MAELLVELLGKPHGIIMFQLLAACRFTIYLSLIAFVGGGTVACVITLFRISKNPHYEDLRHRLYGCFNLYPC